MDQHAQKPLAWYIRMIAGRNPLVTLVRAVVWVALIVVLFKFVLVGIRVRGDSMEPTFHDGQIKFVNRLAYLRSTPKRGDVVAVRAPGLRAVFLKRIVGLPGEEVSIRRGGVYINGEKIGDQVFNEIFHPVAIQLIDHCDAVLRIGGPSAGADEMVKEGEARGKIIFTSMEEIVNLNAWPEE